MWELYKAQRNYTTTSIREAKWCYYIKLNNKLSDSFRLKEMVVLY